MQDCLDGIIFLLQQILFVVKDFSHKNVVRMYVRPDKQDFFVATHDMFYL